MEKVKIKDLLNYQWIHDLEVRGDQAVAVLTQMDAAENNYRHDLTAVDLETGTLRPLTSDGRVSAFVFEDRRTLLFCAQRKAADEAAEGTHKTVFYRLSLNWGEAQRAFEIPMEVLALKRIEGTPLAVITVLENRHQQDWETWSEAKRKDQKDYVILGEVPFVANGSGFIDGQRTALWLWNLETETGERLTPEYFETSRFVVEGGRIWYTGCTWTDVCPKTAGLYSYDLDLKQTREWVKPGQYRLGALAVSGQQAVYMATDMEAYGGGTSCDFWRLDAATGKTWKAADYEYSIGSVINSDVRFGSGKTFALKDSTLYFTSTVGSRTELYTLTADNEIVRTVAFDGALSGFDFTAGGLVFCAMESGRLQEVYTYDPQNGCRRLTQISEKCLAGKAIQPVIEAHFTNRAGMEIDGWLIRPVDFDPTKTYPGILDIHGGPRTAYGTLLVHEMQVWASEGYFVFFCNHRGSDGYGDAFADLRSRYGTIDYEDIMDFTESVLKANPQLDSARLGVTGGSYGGYMTNWIIGHTDRFAAAASQRSIANWISDYGTSGISYDDDLNGGAQPWTDIETMWEHSPLKYAAYCTTPTLFIHSFEDYTCAVSQAMEMFTALKMLGIETRACLFKGENHELSRKGKPLHRFKRLEEITGWMNHKLKSLSE